MCMFRDFLALFLLLEKGPLLRPKIVMLKKNYFLQVKLHQLQCSTLRYKEREENQEGRQSGVEWIMFKGRLT